MKNLFKLYALTLVVSYPSIMVGMKEVKEVKVPEGEIEKVRKLSDQKAKRYYLARYPESEKLFAATPKVHTNDDGSQVLLTNDEDHNLNLLGHFNKPVSHIKVVYDAHTHHGPIGRKVIVNGKELENIGINFDKEIKAAKSSDDEGIRPHHQVAQNQARNEKIAELYRKKAKLYKDADKNNEAIKDYNKAIEHYKESAGLTLAIQGESFAVVKASKYESLSKTYQDLADCYEHDSKEAQAAQAESEKYKTIALEKIKTEAVKDIENNLKVQSEQEIQQKISELEATKSKTQDPFRIQEYETKIERLRQELPLVRLRYEKLQGLQEYFKNDQNLINQKLNYKTAYRYQGSFDESKDFMTAMRRYLATVPEDALQSMSVEQIVLDAVPEKAWPTKLVEQQIDFVKHRLFNELQAPVQKPALFNPKFHSQFEHEESKEVHNLRIHLDKLNEILKSRGIQKVEEQSIADKQSGGHSLTSKIDVEKMRKLDQSIVGADGKTEAQRDFLKNRGGDSYQSQQQDYGKNFKIHTNDDGTQVELPNRIADVLEKKGHFNKSHVSTEGAMRSFGAVTINGKIYYNVNDIPDITEAKFPTEQQKGEEQSVEAKPVSEYYQMLGLKHSNYPTISEIIKAKEQKEKEDPSKKDLIDQAANMVAAHREAELWRKPKQVEAPEEEKTRNQRVEQAKEHWNTAKKGVEKNQGGAELRAGYDRLKKVIEEHGGEKEKQNNMLKELKTEYNKLRSYTQAGKDGWNALINWFKKLFADDPKLVAAAEAEKTKK